MSRRFHFGVLDTDAEASIEAGKRGWVLGNFMPEGTQQCNTLQVKRWRLLPETDGRTHETKTDGLDEVDLILTGKGSVLIDGEKIEFDCSLTGPVWCFTPAGMVNSIPHRVDTEVTGFSVKAGSGYHKQVLTPSTK